MAKITKKTRLLDVIAYAALAKAPSKDGLIAAVERFLADGPRDDMVFWLEQVEHDAYRMPEDARAKLVDRIELAKLALGLTEDQVRMRARVIRRNAPLSNMG